MRDAQDDPARSVWRFWAFLAIFSASVGAPFVIGWRGPAEAAPIHHVAPTGHDAGPGTERRPWRTLGHAAAEAAAGATIRVAPGTYRERVVIARPGLAFEGAPDGKSVVDGMGGSAFALAPGVDRVAIRGFRLTGCGRAIALPGGNDEVAIEDVAVTRSDVGVRLTLGDHGAPVHGGVRDVLIARCTFEDLAFSAIDGTPGPVQRLLVAGCTIARNGASAGTAGDGVVVPLGDHVVIEDCMIRGNAGDGVDVGARDRRPEAGNRVGRCRVRDNGGAGVKLWHGGEVVDTVLTGNGQHPLAFMQGGTYVVRGCTVVRNARHRRDFALVAGADPAPEGGQPRQRLAIHGSTFAYNGPPGAPIGLYIGPETALDEGGNTFFSRPDEELWLDGREPANVTRADVAAGRWPAGPDRHAGSRAEAPALPAGMGP